MSRIHDLGPKLEGIPALLDEYETAFEQIESNLTLKGKSLDFALKEQSSWPIYYDARKAELRTLVKFMDDQVNKVRGRLTRQFVENYSRQIGERLISTYVDAEPEFIKMRELYFEVEELYEKFSAAAEAFNKRGFALRDLTTARVHQIQDSTL